MKTTDFTLRPEAITVMPSKANRSDIVSRRPWLLPLCSTISILLLPALIRAQTIVTAPADDSEEFLAVQAEELWRVGGFGEEESDFFGYVSDVVCTPEGTTYLLDRQLGEIKAYDAEGNYLNKFGRAGEGPGEFLRPQTMLLLPDGSIGVLHGRPQRFERFSPEGEILESLRVGSGESMSFVMGAASVNGTVVLNRRSMTIDDKKITTRAEVVGIEEDGSLGTIYLEQVSENQRLGPGITINLDNSFAGAWALGYDGLLHVSNAEDEYRIDSYDASGKMVRVIQRPYEHRKRTAKEMASLKKQEAGRGGPGRGEAPEIPEYDRDISRLISRPNGDLWVLDSRGRARDTDDHLGTFVVYDPQGQMVRRVRIEAPFHPGRDRFYIRGDRLYVVEEAISAMRNMFAGFGGAVVIDGADEEDEEPDPLSVVCYRLPGVDG